MKVKQVVENVLPLINSMFLSIWELFLVDLEVSHMSLGSS